jgi:hypothetical protein
VAGNNSGAGWRVAELSLFPIWVLAAAITMAPELGKVLRLSGTLFSSYGADLSFPAWFYIVCRHRPGSRVAGWIGRSPGFAAASIFAVGVVSEFAQRFLPRLVAGTYDPLDIVAYGVGLATCLFFDLRGRARTSPVEAAIR